MPGSVSGILGFKQALEGGVFFLRRRADAYRKAATQRSNTRPEVAASRLKTAEAFDAAAEFLENRLFANFDDEAPADDVPYRRRPLGPRSRLMKERKAAKAAASAP